MSGNNKLQCTKDTRQKSETLRNADTTAPCDSHRYLLKAESCQFYHHGMKTSAEKSFILHFHKHCMLCNLPRMMYGMPVVRVLERHHCQSC